MVFPHDPGNCQLALDRMEQQGEQPDGEVLLSMSLADLQELFANRSIARKIHLRLDDVRESAEAHRHRGKQQQPALAQCTGGAAAPSTSGLSRPQEPQQLSQAAPPAAGAPPPADGGTTIEQTSPAAPQPTTPAAPPASERASALRTKQGSNAAHQPGQGTPARHLAQAADAVGAQEPLSAAGEQPLQPPPATDVGVLPQAQAIQPTEAAAEGPNPTGAAHAAESTAAGSGPSAADSESSSDEEGTEGTEAGYASNSPMPSSGDEWHPRCGPCRPRRWLNFERENMYWM